MGHESPWNHAESYWLVSGLFTNVVTYFLLQHLWKKDGKKYFTDFIFVKQNWWQDFLVSFGISFVLILLSIIPNIVLGNILFSSSEVATKLLFRPLPIWVILIGFIWALTQGLVELPFYFAYVMKKIENQINNNWIGYLFASIFLALQHITLPFILNPNFIIWRFGMFLLLSLFLGLCLKLRPRLFPYLMISHAILDIMAVMMFLNVK
jgi:membrane protease YdiL (CAAX protease family)